MDFFKYIFDLLGTTFFNPDGWLYSVFGWLTALWILVIFAMPKLEKKMNKSVLVWVKHHRQLILVFLILASIVVSAYTIQNNIDRPNRPLLTLAKSTTVSILVDEEQQTTSGNIDFNITNIGGSAAYQTLTRICYAPASKPQNIYQYPDLTGTNPIQPQDMVIVPTGITQAFTKSNSTMMVESDTWYVYYQIKYSDSPTNGKWYSDEYWFALEFNTGRVRDLTITEKQIFQPLIDAFYS